MKKMNGNIPEYYPLTHAQKRIYYDEKIFPGTGWANNTWLVKYKEILAAGGRGKNSINY